MPHMSAVYLCVAAAALALAGCSGLPVPMATAPAPYPGQGPWPSPRPSLFFANFAEQPPDYSPDYVYGPDGQLVPKACLVGDATELPALGPHLPPGCANAHNLARMAESKSDLLYGRPHGAAPAAPTARAAQEYIYGAGPQKGTLGGGLPRTPGSAPQGPGAESETEKPPATR